MNPDIIIDPGPEGLNVAQRRPAVAAALVGKPINEALQQVSALLPVCGAAQLVAARRAVEGAWAHEENPEESARRDGRLWREQALAAAWRLTVDWPDLVGEPRRLDRLKQLRGTGDARDLATGLRSLINGFDHVQSVDAALDVAVNNSSLAARVVRAALGHGPTAADTPIQLVRGESLAMVVLGAFSLEPFDPCHPWAEKPVEVGPLAMGRDPLIDEIRARLGTTPAARLIATLLDTRAIAAALEGNGTATAPRRSWTLDPGCGLGVAMTARGPVFHRVTIDDHNSMVIGDWRVLAPTDWHFSPDGPVAASGGTDRDALRFVVASFDPCAPWRLGALNDGG
ncbi:MAG: hypothetical protein AAGE01_07365 [Pseudomonadota bacterium]